MNCKLHPEKTAVGTCEKCGCGVCEECSAATASTGNFCVKCAYDETVQDIEFDRQLRKKLKRSTIVLLTVWIIGFPLFLAGVIMAVKSSGENMTALYLLLSGIIISGVPSAIEYWRLGAKVHRKMENTFGATYHVSEDGSVYKDQGWSTKLMYAGIGLFMGLLINPQKIIKNYKFIKEIDEELREITAIKSQLARFYNKSVGKKTA